MTNIVLFHSALGLNDGMHAMERVLTDAGHTVFTPDFYEGKVFTETKPGIAYRDEVTFPELARRAAAAVEDLAAEVTAGPLVFGGFSLGAAMAQSFGKRHPNAAGALLFHAGGVPKPTSWQPGAALQIHHSVGDEWVDADQAAMLISSAAQAGAQASHFVYPGEAHLFADPTSPDYEQANADLMWERVLAFLARVGR